MDFPIVVLGVLAACFFILPRSLRHVAGRQLSILALLVIGLEVVITSGVLLDTLTFSNPTLSFLISGFTITVSYLALPRELKLRIGKSAIGLAGFVLLLLIMAVGFPSFRQLIAAMRSQQASREIRVNHKGTFGEYIAFDICNWSDRPLEHISFQVSGFVEGDTTPRPLELVSGDRTRFMSDRPVAVRSCEIVHYVGPYLPFDSYRTALTNASFRGIP